MARVALLIGVSEYGSGLAGLPGTEVDLKAMQQVLRNPQVCNFEAVETLLNPDPTQMLGAIETLFTENRNRDDLVLLYFSGHGVRDDNGTLYFATRITEKNSQGRIRTSTAVPAARLQEYMSQSRSKRQVLILDCCFSGAFANDMKAKAVDAAIDVKTQLGGEGRAVLTSSTATQVSYEKEGASIYTRYLVEGLATGAADRDGDGQITIDELHEYAKEKVQEAAPTMQPEIYAVREGYKILIARAPQEDPKLIFRKEFDERAKQKRGKLSGVDVRALKFLSKELNLSDQAVGQIIDEVLRPYQAFWEKVTEFEQAVKEALQFDPQLSKTTINDLQYLQRILKLRDEDISPILKAYKILPTVSGSASTSAKTKSESTYPTLANNLVRTGLANTSTQPPALEPKLAPIKPAQTDDPNSEKGIDYTRLHDLLKAQKWKEADQETYEVILRAVRKNRGDWFTSKELLNFPCTDLKTIDGLWVKYSKGHFGFSVQKQIYVECGANLDGKYPGDEIWEKFGNRVGWRKDGRWLSYDDLNPSFSCPRGSFPGGFGWRILGVCGWVGKYGVFFSRLETCRCTTTYS